MRQFQYYLILLFLSSCALHSGSVSTTPLSEKYIYEDIAFGASQTSRIFGIGGLSKDAMVLEAKRQLFRNRPLKMNEAYANFTVDFKRTSILIYDKTVVTVSADIVLKTDSSDFNRFSKNYIKKLDESYIHSPLFQVGDTVTDKKLNKGVIIGVEKNDKIRVLYSIDNNYKSKKETIYSIFSLKKSYKGLTIGEKIESKKEEINGTISAFGVNGFLYQDKDGYTYFSKYIKVTNTK